MPCYFVKIYYGPTESIHRFPIYKPQKLRGLREHLQKIGFRVNLIPVEFINYCMLEMGGHEVFRCNMKNLRFNCPHHMDPVCQRAIDAVIKSSEKLKRARSYLLYWNLINHELSSKSKYTRKDYWPDMKDSEEFKTSDNVLMLANKERYIYRLQKIGYRVDLVPTNFANYCLLEMCGHEVFRCNIQHLNFNTPYHLDPVCQRAVEAVVESSAKLQRGRTYLLFGRIIQDELFRRSEFSPKDYWPCKEEPEEYISCLKCATCCNIFLKKKSM